MRREQLEQLLSEVVRVMGTREVVVIGSQCVHAVTDAAPAEVLISLECDVLVSPGQVADRLRAELGPTSPFRAEHGTYVDAVNEDFPTLPRGWRSRLQRIGTGRVLGECLEIHDLVVSKLAAGRLKDYELVAALITRKLVDVTRVRERIGEIEELRMKAILLARLQIVLESVP